MKKSENVRIKFRAEELSGFCAQLAMMLESGMTLYDGMEMIVETHRNSPNAECYEALSSAMNETGSLHAALVQCGVWPEYLVEMTGIGERTGKLESVMNGLADYYGREGRIRRAVVSAVTYPLVLGVMMLLILLIMIIKVLPVFRRVLANFGVEMTDSGNAIMQIGVTAGWVILAAVAVFVVAVLACCLMMKLGFKAQVVSFAGRVVPGIRNIRMKLASSRVASVMSMMLSGGFPLDEALEMIPAVLDDSVARERVSEMREKVAGGKSFADAVVESGLFDEFYSGLIRTSAAVGNVDGMMEKVAAEYENRVEEGIAGLVSIIEPTLVAVLSVVIGAVLLSVMLPMAGIISSIL